MKRELIGRSLLVDLILQERLEIDDLWLNPFVPTSIIIEAEAWRAWHHRAAVTIHVRNLRSTSQY
jgi:hypothetical protein